MIRNQFWYTTKDHQGNPTKASFSVDLVVQSFEYEPGKIGIELSNYHEQVLPIEVRNKSGKMETQMRKSITNCQIILEDPQDVEKWISLSDISVGYIPTRTEGSIPVPGFNGFIQKKQEPVLEEKEMD